MYASNAFYFTSILLIFQHLATLHVHYIAETSLTFPSNLVKKLLFTYGLVFSKIQPHGYNAI
uniref:Uncharacterized protein n=1 Tax=Histophilus somni (strain 129Pt) TaxID=205914 RepID=Q0I1F0_HISS1